MIHDSLNNFGKYASLHPRFAKVAEFLASNNLSELPQGRIEILPNGELFANVQTATGVALESANVEYHRKYIDVQVPLATTEQMGWMPTAKVPASIVYDDEADCGYGPAKPTSYVTVNPGEFTIFFPQDTHAPCIGDGLSMPKVIFKVRVD
ncbi:MAG: YhcH/YjgK/YiaL family protein [Lentisphaeria bacterium]|nr:YhcH/YjgK/YiaL family protein [Lentisphaeria bacterium]